MFEHCNWKWKFCELIHVEKNNAAGSWCVLRFRTFHRSTTIKTERFCRQSFGDGRPASELGQLFLQNRQRYNRFLFSIDCHRERQKTLNHSLLILITEKNPSFINRWKICNFSFSQWNNSLVSLFVVSLCDEREKRQWTFLSSDNE